MKKFNVSAMVGPLIVCVGIILMSIPVLSYGQDVPLIEQLTPADLGTFPNGEHVPYYTVHGTSDVQFRAWLVDGNTPASGSIGQTVIADFTGDGQSEYLVGGSGGKYIYKPAEDGSWTRFQIRPDRGPTDAGAVVLDLTGNGLLDIIAGKAWYRNPGFENGAFLDDEWEEFFYGEVTSGSPIHDQILADVSGDGRLDMIILEDNFNPSGVRWYRIPEDPTEQWERHDIGIATHQGIAPRGFGDLNGSGHIDIVRADIWWENVNGDGSWWRPHSLGAIHSLPPGRLDDAGFANGTQSWVADINGNGRLDIVQADGEARGGRVWWLENLGVNADGSINWQRHIIAGGLRNMEDGESVYLGRVLGGIHSLCVGDFSGNGRKDVFTIEQDWQRARPGPEGEDEPLALLWENLGEGFDGTILFYEHVIADVNLGGHETVCGDMTGNGRIDIITKPWSASENNAVDGNAFILFLENITP
jgi:hypothetical protein